VSLLHGDLCKIILASKRKVSRTVDERERFIYDGALSVIPMAVNFAAVEKGMISLPCEIGKLPLIVACFDEKEAL
jgi:hypothetical protein